MEFEKIPTIPTADEILDRSFRRASRKVRERKNRDRANVAFVYMVSHAVHDRLVAVMQAFPDFDTIPQFYKDIVEILYGTDRIRQSLGAVGWAARFARDHGPGFAYQTRTADETARMRKRAVARLSSVVRQIDPHLRFLNEVRNVLRTLPHVEDTPTVVIAGYPNVGKSSFIRLVSSADPQIASYPFTTKGIIVGHRQAGRARVQFIDTPGILERPPSERNAIEQQAVAAITHLADVILFILDASESCGYPLAQQEGLLAEIQANTDVPVVVAVNKADLAGREGVLSMSALTGEGVDTVLHTLLSLIPPPEAAREGRDPQESQG